MISRTFHKLWHTHAPLTVSALVTALVTVIFYCRNFCRPTRDYGHSGVAQAHQVRRFDYTLQPDAGVDFRVCSGVIGDWSLSSVGF